jgi:hypothetical protein
VSAAADRVVLAWTHRRVAATSPDALARRLRTWRRVPGFAASADLAAILVWSRGGMPERAIDELARVGLERALPALPIESLQVAWATSVDVGRAATEAAPWERLNGEEVVRVAGWALSAGDEATARLLIAQADEGAPGARERREWLDYWLAPVGAGPRGNAPRLAVLDYRHPWRERGSINVGDWVQSIAFLGNVVGHPDLAIETTDDLSGLVGEIRARVRVETAERPRGRIALAPVQRDASSLDVLRDPTWMIAYGWYQWPLSGHRLDFPFRRELRPVFLSFHLNDDRLLDAAGIEYLRAHAPIGCRDVATTRQLRALGIPAFFSGCVTTTLGGIFPPPAGPRPTAVAEVDWEPAGDGRQLVQIDPGVTSRTTGGNLGVAFEYLRGLQADFGTVRTSRLHSYLPARALGLDVEFRPPDPADPRFTGLIGISDEEFARIARSLRERIARVLARIAEEPDEATFRQWWREETGEDAELDVPEAV